MSLARLTGFEAHEHNITRRLLVRLGVLGEPDVACTLTHLCI